MATRIVAQAGGINATTSAGRRNTYNNKYKRQTSLRRDDEMYQRRVLVSGIVLSWICPMRSALAEETQTKTVPVKPKLFIARDFLFAYPRGWKMVEDTELNGDPMADRRRQNVVRGEVVGGSISWGQGASDRDTTSWVATLFDWIRTAYPHANDTLVNGAVSATPSAYMALCWRYYVPPHPDFTYRI